MHLVPPFILLDDARPDGAPVRLYRSPVEVVTAAAPADVTGALERVRQATRAGRHAAGYLTYEAAAAFEPAVARPPSGEAATAPLVWFGVFDDVTMIDRDAVAALLPDPDGAWVGAPQPAIDRATYGDRLDRVLALIAAGDFYQANLTFAATVPFVGNPVAVYAQLRKRAGAGYGALIHDGRGVILSFSPELFFTLDGGRIECRPMKGTARRGDTADADRAAIAALADDPKQRAENLMIVDLMRNDIARVAVPGSVAVPSLFAVETYPSVHQMVSTVTADLAPGNDAVDVIAALFPCGSITGAPKIRAIQALAEIEAAPRGLYTGAIGHIDPAGDAMFNVAIRTLTIAPGADVARFATGGGIVADSTAAGEWDEAAAKGAFLTEGQRRFDLIETMAFDPAAGIALIDRHLARIKESADRFGFTFDRHAARNELQAATFRLGMPSRVRLMLSASGAFAIETSALPPPLGAPASVAVVPLPVDPADFRLRHKTTDRAFYDAARQAAGTDEVVFALPDGRLTEGSFTNIFVARDGMLLTPPTALGLLPGVLRADLIETGRATEAVLTIDDLAGVFLIGNALRGLMPAEVAPQQSPTL